LKKDCCGITYSTTAACDDKKFVQSKGTIIFA